MKEFKNGTRVGVVGAIRDDGKIDFLGFGTFEGVEIPPGEPKSDIPVPKIKLENGETVWGNEIAFCGAENAVKQFLSDESKVNRVSLADFRKKSKSQPKSQKRSVTVTQLGHEFGMKLSEEVTNFWQTMFASSKSTELADGATLHALASCVAATMAEFMAPKDASKEEYNAIFNQLREQVLDFIVANFPGTHARETTPVDPAAAKTPGGIIIDGT